MMVKHGNKVGVDVNGRARLTNLADYEKSVHPNTWKATMHFADSLKDRKMKIAFFNSTPQGGGVALMRHALIRFLRLVGVHCEWYVPREPGTHLITNRFVGTFLDQSMKFSASRRTTTTFFKVSIRLARN